MVRFHVFFGRTSGSWCSDVQVNQVYQEDHIMEALPMDEIEKRFGKAGSQDLSPWILRR